MERYPDPYERDPDERRARKAERDAARCARRGDGPGAENLMRIANAIRREAGLPHAVAQVQRRDEWYRTQRTARGTP